MFQQGSYAEARVKYEEAIFLFSALLETSLATPAEHKIALVSRPFVLYSVFILGLLSVVIVLYLALHPSYRETLVLLDKAQRALEADRLIAPEGDNAVMYSSEILGLNANHAEAKRILEAVVSRLTVLGETAVQQGDLLHAKSHHQAAESVARQFKISETEVRRIAELIAATEKRLTEEAKQKPLAEEQRRRTQAAQIEALLSKARQALTANRLATPVGDNAVEYAEQLLALAPNQGGHGRS